MFRINEISKIASSNLSQHPNGQWVPSRPITPPFAIRLKDAWLVLMGKADAVEWDR